MHHTVVDGIRIAYDDLGARDAQGPAFLLLPGWCTDRTVFAPLAERLATFGRTLVMDWAGHGDSERPVRDFGAADLLAQARGVMADSGVEQVIPITVSHAGWVALELRRALGERVAGLVFLDWIVSPAPPPFSAILTQMQSPDWRAAVEQIFGMWLHGVDNEHVIRFVREGMGAYPGTMWARAGREISASYLTHGNPLSAASQLNVRAIHLYGQPDDPGYLAYQQEFAAQHAFFQVKKLATRSHFPTLECPDVLVDAIRAWLANP